MFAEQGYEATTVAEIADAADMSTRTFFRHVRDKDEAMFAADEDAFADVLRAAAAAGAHAPPLARLLHGVRVLAAAAGEDAEAKCARERVLEENPALRARDLAQQLRWQQQSEQFLRAQGVDADEASLAAGLTLTIWREAYRRWIAVSAVPGALGEFLDTVAGELPGQVAVPGARSR
nr:TetR/AcrR family transcriptional regulator [Kineococcus vitellinus]